MAERSGAPPPFHGFGIGSALALELPFLLSTLGGLALLQRLAFAAQLSFAPFELFQLRQTYRR
jgi:hypothetical protein